ncbi:vacuolar protein sorting-associated protein 36 [Phtheirospermum japonicum]|uniref:Vacuolar protein-sorting-associated protein 36 n=1 Tax=Phtheirospermum japonicum TaxID=374723 RepID=A0A830D0M0_9LAMI|nr:vacuolar protein sorting-associated protein 36 [Phtheirospermum japonicum]
MTGALLPAADMTASGRPVLKSGEVECSLLSAVDLLSEDFPTFPHLKSGVLILTTHRLLWLPSETTTTTTTRSPPPCFIPLSAIQHIFSTKSSSIKSMFHSPRIRFQVSATPNGAITDKGGLKSLSITLIVRGKTDPDSFLGKFWEAWRVRAWEACGSSDSSEGPASESLAIRAPVVGLAGILRKEQEMWESTDKSLQDAFQDLNALMFTTAKSRIYLRSKIGFKMMELGSSKAKEMVMLAEKMRLKLLSGSTNQVDLTNDDEMGTKEEMQDWLLSVGIVSPVTKESAGAMYHQQLSRQNFVVLFIIKKKKEDRKVLQHHKANITKSQNAVYRKEKEDKRETYAIRHMTSPKQLADFVKIPLERGGGMINLIDIYCLFNRARGTELISPDDLLQACSLWEKFDVYVPFGSKLILLLISVMLRKFDSGVMVIQSKTHSDEETKANAHKAVAGPLKILSFAKFLLLYHDHPLPRPDFKVFARIKSLIMKPEALVTGISASNAARTLGVSPAMAKEYLLAAEGKGMTFTFIFRSIKPSLMTC